MSDRPAPKRAASKTAPPAPSWRRVNVTMFYSVEEGVEPYELGDVPIPSQGQEIHIGLHRSFLVTGVKYNYRTDDPGWCNVTIWTMETSSLSPMEVFDEELQEWRVMTPEEIAEDDRLG